MNTKLFARNGSVISCLMTVMIAVGLSGCSSDNNPFDDGNHRIKTERKPMKYTYNLSFGGDYVKESEEPLYRADDNKKTYVGINVTRKEKDNIDAKFEKYAYGIFPHEDNITIDLYSGFEYAFEATILTDGTDKLLNSNNGGFSYPFTKKSETDITNADHEYEKNDIDKFVYTFQTEKEERYGLNQLNKGSSYVKTSSHSYDYGNFAYPRVHRYYGNVSGIYPEELASSDGKININMNYRSFCLEIDATEIPEGTYITIEDKTGLEIDGYEHLTTALKFPENFTLEKETAEKELKYSEIYSLYDMNTAEATFNLQFTWHRGMGKEETFNSNSIKVQANTKKILKIIINGEANTKAEGNIILNKEDITLSETDAQEITHSQGSKEE